MENKYQEALEILAPCKEDGYECIACKDIEICKERQAYRTLQELIDNYSKLEKALELYQKALELYGKQVYEKDDYTCNGYCCVVATTHYEPDEEKKICSRCLGDRLLDQARKELENGK